MITKTAMVGLAHFLMQADPVTAQHVLNQLPVKESEQVVQIIESEDSEPSKLPEVFKQKVTKGGDAEASSPSFETSSGI